MPSPAHLLLTGSARRAVHRQLSVNRWMNIWVYISVPVNSQPWIARCRDCYDPQLVKRSSEWVRDIIIIFESTVEGTSLHELTSFEPFCAKIGREIELPGRGRKSQKFTDFHGNDISPWLTVTLDISRIIFEIMMHKAREYLFPTSHVWCKHASYYFAEFIFTDFSMIFPDKMNDLPVSLTFSLYATPNKPTVGA